jgi:hypothetical protein
MERRAGMENEQEPIVLSDSSYIVVRQFEAGGHSWKPNDVFDASICTPRQLRLLKDTRRIVDPSEPKMTRARQKWLGINHSSTISKRVTLPKVDGQKTQASTNPDDPDAYRVEHVGRGRYCIFQGEIRISEPMKKGEAEDQVKELEKVRAAVAQGSAENVG